MSNRISKDIILKIKINKTVADELKKLIPFKNCAKKSRLLKSFYRFFFVIQIHHFKSQNK